MKKNTLRQQHQVASKYVNKLWQYAVYITMNASVTTLDFPIGCIASSQIITNSMKMRTRTQPNIPTHKYLQTIFRSACLRCQYAHLRA